MQLALGNKYFFINGQLTVFEDRIVIEREGIRDPALFRGFAGAKTIPMSAIQTVQLREGSNMVRGYLQFGILGEGGVRGGTAAASSDENALLTANKWDGKPKFAEQNEVAKCIKEYIEKKIIDRENAPNGTVIQQTSSADELLKFKSLLDSGIITQEEFDAKKKQLLGL